MSSVTGVIFSENRQSVLLIKRRDVPVWVLPGGGIEPGENPEEAIVREIFEETGFHTKILRQVGLYEPINRLSRKTFLFECSILTGKALINAETKEITFFSLKNLPKLLPPPYDTWILETQKNFPFLIERKLQEVTYRKLLLQTFLHPLLVFRFLLAKMGFPINT